MESNRQLSIAEYFNKIQEEYLIAQFRHKIYYSPRDRRYWLKVMNYKKEKIDNIASRNNLNSIFNSDKKMQEIRNKVFDVSGKPRFTMTEEDIKNYYSSGSDFSYKGEIYTLDLIRTDGNLQLYSNDKQEFEVVNKDEVCRIL